MVKPDKDFVQELLRASKDGQFLPDHSYLYGKTKSCSERDPDSLSLGSRESEHKLHLVVGGIDFGIIVS